MRDTAPYASMRISETQAWRDIRSDRAVIGNRIGADAFSPRGLLFALPMASLIWLALALAIFPKG